MQHCCHNNLNIYQVMLSTTATRIFTLRMLFPKSIIKTTELKNLKETLKFNTCICYCCCTIYSIHIRGVIKKLPLSSNFVSYVCLIFAFFFSVMLVHMSVIYVDNISRIVNLFLTDTKVSQCFGVLFDFFIFDKMDQRNYVLSFV